MIAGDLLTALPLAIRALLQPPQPEDDEES
jgi:hypothetical protein